ncbi:MAG: choice-of-anchor X domain-containing protein [Candidatus Promineifilaceae bacterium]
MKLDRYKLLLFPIGFAVVALGLLAGLLHATGADLAGSNKTLVVAADATAGMQPQLNALADAWPGSLVGQDGVARQYHLLAYRDAVQYLGSTDNEDEFRSLLRELNAAGGGDCPDAVFQALRAAARGAPDSRALLFGGSAPQGDSSTLAYIVNKLVERRVSAYPAISGWCTEASLTQEALSTLALLTGGLPFPHEAEEAETAAERAFNAMALADTLMIGGEMVDGESILPLTLDSTATTLGVNQAKCCRCLTCTLAVRQSPSLVDLPSDTNMTIRDPDGDILTAGDPGVELLDTSMGRSILIDIAQVYTPDPGEASATWEIIVDGEGEVLLRADADTGVHLTYPGSHVMRAGNQRPLRAILRSDAAAPAIDQTSVQFLMINATNGQEFELALFDDGQHGDGQAGDGLYGGRVNARPGIWYLAARGKLADGGAFERLYEVPLRVKSFEGRKPGDNQQVAGNSTMLRFQVTNEVETARSQATQQMYELSLESLQGWATAADLPRIISLAPGETATFDVQLTVPENTPADTQEETSLTVMEFGNIAGSETLSVVTTVVDEMNVFLPAAIRP